MNRTVAFCFSGFVCAVGLFAQRPVTDDPRERLPKPNYDAFLASPIRKALTGAQQESVRAAVKPGSQVHMEERLGVPSFLWAADPGQPTPIGPARNGKRTEEVVARAHLARYRAVYQLSSSDVDSAPVASIHNTGRGAVIVKLRQAMDGIEVFRESVSIAMTRTLELLSISGYLSPVATAPPFALQPQDAVARALTDLLDSQFSATQIMNAGAASGYGLYTLAPAAQNAEGIRMTDVSRAKRVIFRLPDRVESGYYVEVNAQNANGGGWLAYGYVISAADGRVLLRKNLVADADLLAAPAPYNYRVWAENTSALKSPFDNPAGNSAIPHPTGVPDGFQPDFVLSRAVSLLSGPISTKDPWLPAGATKTIGNNVEAYADLAAPDGFVPGTADTHAQTTGGRTFNHVYNLSLSPLANAEQTQASVTQLFYTNNFLHDSFYDAGFDEASGNAQDDNYGRGGLEGDSIRAEAQDFGGFDNANMFTPDDGARPRMQMYLFHGLGDRSLTVNAPSSIAGQYAVGLAAFGPTAFQVTANLVLVNDGVAATSVTDGCETPFTNAAAVSGKIALIDRGTCAFTVKVKNAQLNGAIGALIANNVPGIVGMIGIDPTITIGSLMASLEDANLIKAQLAGNTVNVSLIRKPAVDRDGSLDSQIVAHEWGHYISNRLVFLGTNMSRGLGEGWGDFHALLLTVKRGDIQVPANSNYSGAYPAGTYPLGGGSNGPFPNNAFYFGIRRVPYSTDFSKNPLTFKHISDAAPFPSGVPAQPNSAPNWEVHNTGEIWATMLWECYAALLRDTLAPGARLTFEKARDRMVDYVVAAYKMTPPNPTLLEARDAMLIAALANDFKDFTLFWEAFARRGAGTGAVAPDRFSFDNTPVVESFVAGGALAILETSLSDDVVSCDNDGLLDGGETGRFFVTIRNEGARRLTKTTATVSSSNPDVVFPNGNKISFPATSPFEVATDFVRVRLRNGASGLQRVDLKISLNDPTLDPDGPVLKTFEAYGNADVALNTSAIDNVESPVSAWTSAIAIGPEGWQRVVTGASPFNHTWHGPDPGTIADIALISPVLKVGPGQFRFSFRHRFSFEADDFGLYDGGVVEISADGGTTWTDIGVGYNGTIVDVFGNPLGGREAYTATSASYPAFNTTTINLGTAYKNKDMLIRFRIGSDIIIGSNGWDIDNLTFTGLTNTPFHTLVADTGCP